MFSFAKTCKVLTVAALSANVYVAAQVPQPAAEPGSVPETQPAPQVSPSPAPTQTPTRAVRITGGVAAGLRIGGDRPHYPPEAKARGVSGSVVLHAVIGKDGNVAKLQVISGDPLLTDAAVAAVQTWTYTPYLLNGEPTEVDTTVTVNFNLSPTPIDPDPGPPIIRDGHPILRAGGTVLQGMRVSSVPPIYPQRARNEHVEGTVILRVVIGKDGSVQEVSVASGPPELTGAAVEAVKQWKYKPFLVKGEPMELQSTVTVNFNLAN